MRKSVVIGFILLAVIAGFMRQTQVADPVRVALASAQLAFPAQLLPQISVGGAAQPTKVTDHWYSPLRTKDGARLRFGYVQSEQMGQAAHGTGARSVSAGRENVPLEPSKSPLN